MRKCFGLRWKTPRGRINALQRLGVKGRALGIGYTGLGAWRVARIWAMHQALKNSTLNRYGVIIPWDFAEVAPWPHPIMSFAQASDEVCKHP